MKLLTFFLLTIIFLIGLVVFAWAFGVIYVGRSSLDEMTVSSLKNVSATNETIANTLVLIYPGEVIIYMAFGLVFLTFIIAFLVLIMEAMVLR